jgi:hypothetical protein
MAAGGSATSECLLVMVEVAFGAHGLGDDHGSPRFCFSSATNVSGGASRAFSARVAAVSNLNKASS